MNNPPNYVVTKDYLNSMKTIRTKLFKKYEYVVNENKVNLLVFRQACHNQYSCKGLDKDIYTQWDTLVSNYVKYIWGTHGVDENINGKNMEQTKNEIIREIGLLWIISSYLGLMTNNKVNITSEVRYTTPPRNNNLFILTQFKEPTSERGNTVHVDNDPFNIKSIQFVDTLPSQNKIVDIVKDYVQPVIIAALSGFIIYLINKDKEMPGMVGGTQGQELVSKFINNGVTSNQISEYLEQNPQYVKDIIKNVKAAKVSEKDFAEFGLKDDENIFGFMNTGSRGGKRKRSAKRGTNKNKKNKKSNRKRRA